MMGSKNSKRITWAPDHNLCQVRLFPSAKLPSKVGLGRPQTKASWAVVPDPDVPPGFEKPASLKLPRIPCKRWRCPARIELKSEWQMVAGEESKEVEAQKQRERRVLEAVFPRPSSIPPNPRLPVNAQESVVDDQSIPLIPMTQIEEAGASNASAMNIPQQPRDQAVSSQCDGNVSVEGAKPALASSDSNSSNQDQTSLIDPDLLMRILTNPELVELLLIALRQEASAQITPNPELQPKIPSNSTGIAINGQASLSTPNMKTELNAPTTATTPRPAAPFRPPQLRTRFVSTSDTTSIPINGQPLLSNPTTRAELNAPTTATTPRAAPFRPPQLGTGFVSSPPVVKDINYYQSLIQQHGGGGGGGHVLPQSCSQSNRLMGGAAQEFRKPRNPTKSRTMKPCIFFNSNRGCKNGAYCAYQHDILTSQKRPALATQVFGAKRIKLG